MFAQAAFCICAHGSSRAPATGSRGRCSTSRRRMRRSSRSSKSPPSSSRPRSAPSRCSASVSLVSALTHALPLPAPPRCAPGLGLGDAHSGGRQLHACTGTNSAGDSGLSLANIELYGRVPLRGNAHKVQTAEAHATPQVKVAQALTGGCFKVRPLGTPPRPSSASSARRRATDRARVVQHPVDRTRIRECREASTRVSVFGVSAFGVR